MNKKIDQSNKFENYQFNAFIGHDINEMNILVQYKNAVNILIKDLKKTKTRVDMVAYPLLYMMRHSLELGFKYNFKVLEKYSKRVTAKNILYNCHNLETLNNEFKDHINLLNSNFDSDLKKQFSKYLISTTRLISELGATEASSFRYIANTQGKRIFNFTDRKSIGEIKELYDDTLEMLINTSDVVSDLHEPL